jgi:arginine/lysine/ornithine decarboxylase
VSRSRTRPMAQSRELRATREEAQARGQRQENIRWGDPLEARQSAAGRLGSSYGSGVCLDRSSARVFAVVALQHPPRTAVLIPGVTISTGTMKLFSGDTGFRSWP